MKFEQLIKSDRYQVFLFTCPATLPVSIGAHPWFLVNKKGMFSRWEVNWRAHQCKTSWGHLHKNLLPPAEGLSILPFLNRPRWGSRVLRYIEGGEDSLAHEMATFIETSNTNYPYSYTYILTGPNSNTYVQWVLNRFPDSGLKLPWNAFGKTYAQK